MSGEPASSEHTDVGAYALGLLEPQDRQAFEEHLAGCPACAAELAELAGMKDLLTGIGPVESPAGEPGAAEVADLVRRRAQAQRRLTRRQVLLSAAASAALLAGGVGIGLATASQAPPPPPGGQKFSAVGPTGVTAIVYLLPKKWGTQVTLDLSKLRGPLECQLVAVSRTGERRVMSNWTVPKAGFGVPGHPAPLVIEGPTTIKRADLSRLDVIVVPGHTLVSVPV